jgi:hypothetical protein
VTAAIHAPTGCTDSGGARAVTRPGTHCLARLKLAAVVGQSLHVVLRCRTYAVSDPCAVSALDRRLLAIRGLECSETRPAVGEPEKKNSHPCKVRGRKRPPQLSGRLGEKGRIKVLTNPVLEENKYREWTPNLWGPPMQPS